MKIVYVVDSICNFQGKVDTLKNRFGSDILFVVKSNLLPIFQTYGYSANAVYNNNLSKTIHYLLSKLDNLEDVVYIKSSLKLTNNLLNKFISAIGDKSRIVNAMPKRNAFENLGLSCYNIYVRSIFKLQDSLCSTKLQFIPKNFLYELLATHFGNKLFQVKPEMVRTIYFEEKEINNNLKEKYRFDKKVLIPIIVAMLITMAFVLTVFFAKKVNYMISIIFIFFYLLDIMSIIIMNCKSYFDNRFFK